MNLKHILRPKLCIGNAAWHGNYYICTKCQRAIAYQTNGKTLLFPPFNKRKDIMKGAPPQPPWSLSNESDWNDLRKLTLDLLQDHLSDFVPDEIDSPEDEEGDI